MSGSPKGVPVSLQIFYGVLSETVFAHRFERKLKWAAHPKVGRFRLKFLYVVQAKRFSLTFSPFRTKTKMSGAHYTQPMFSRCSYIVKQTKCCTIYQAHRQKKIQKSIKGWRVVSRKRIIKKDLDKDQFWKKYCGKKKSLKPADIRKLSHIVYLNFPHYKKEEF